MCGYNSIERFVFSEVFFLLFEIGKFELLYYYLIKIMHYFESIASTILSFCFYIEKLSSEWKSFKYFNIFLVQISCNKLYTSYDSLGFISNKSVDEADLGLNHRTNHIARVVTYDKIKPLGKNFYHIYVM